MKRYWNDTKLKIKEKKKQNKQTTKKIQTGNVIFIFWVHLN